MPFGLPLPPTRSLALFALTFLIACGDGDSDGVAPPTTGSLTVAVTTTGEPLDADGYSIDVAGTVRIVTGTSVQETYADLPIGSTSVELGDLQENCTVDGANPFNVSVPGGDNATASFEVTCVVPAVTVDGVRGPLEWHGASEEALYEGATLIHRTDGTLLFLGFELEDATLGDDDGLTVRFDNAANGTLDAGEHSINANLSRYLDGHFNGTFWGRVDTDAHGEGAVANTGNGTNFFEFSFPLDSGDPLDFSLAPGSALGYCVIYVKDGTATSATMFPAGCNRAGDDLTRYATLIVGG